MLPSLLFETGWSYCHSIEAAPFPIAPRRATRLATSMRDRYGSQSGAQIMSKGFWAALASASFVAVGASWAQPYPTRAITLIVPYGAGGPLDTLTRIVSERMRVSLGQPIVIDNITGASGVIGVGRAVRAEPDGYTVSVGNWPTHVVNGAIFTLQYDLLHDFEPVALLSSNP